LTFRIDMPISANGQIRARDTKHRSHSLKYRANMNKNASAMMATNTNKTTTTTLDG
jgi:hypothetical protein